MAKGHKPIVYEKPDRAYITQVRDDNRPVRKEFFSLTVPASPVGHDESSDGDPDQGGG